VACGRTRYRFLRTITVDELSTSPPTMYGVQFCPKPPMAARRAVCGEPCWVEVIIPDHDPAPQISVMDDQFGTHRVIERCTCS
jgi:hypothetical protein